jgi:hypothetical protein
MPACRNVIIRIEQQSRRRKKKSRTQSPKSGGVLFYRFCPILFVKHASSAVQMKSMIVNREKEIFEDA